MNLPEAFDHLVLATPDVAATAAWLAEGTGVVAGEGGPHVGLGTRNRLCSLGPGRYLEIIGPDPDQGPPAGPRPFGIDRLNGPVLAGWCLRVGDLESYRSTLARFGVEVGPVMSMRRDTPSGPLVWRLAVPVDDADGGVVPFAIDWGDAPHPSATAPRGLELVEVSVRHPDPDRIVGLLGALGVGLAVTGGHPPGLRATVAGPAGTVELPSR